MHERFQSLRSLILATTVAIAMVLATVGTALADGGGIPYPR